MSLTSATVPTCAASYHSRGCYKDVLGNKALPHLILNVRKPDGPGVDWNNWKTFLPNLICDCANKAKELNYKYFGIQYYGECDRRKKQTEQAQKFQDDVAYF